MSEIPVIDEGPSREKLYRSKEDRWIGGVCGGIGKHLNINPIVIRLLWIIFGFTIVGIFAYIIAMIVIPKEPEW
jgi:phage shock protein C